VAIDFVPLSQEIDLALCNSGEMVWGTRLYAAVRHVEDSWMSANATLELDAGAKTFASGLLPDLIALLRRSRTGELIAVTSHDPSLGAELEAWSRFTRNNLIDMEVEAGRTRWVLRHGEASEDAEEERPVDSRLWLYTNFDCNLSCDYCCVRSSPKAPRRALGIERVRQIASEAAELGVKEIS
jgi:hypothetical protein